MQPRQTPKWLNLFITAFGAKGLVVLAWWLGALHAERIRAAQRSYPLLEVTGTCPAHSSLILSVLWKLLGSEQNHTINLAHSTRAAVLRSVHYAVDMPVVIEEPDRQGAGEAFDWDELKACFTGERMTFRSTGAQVEELKFRGALVIVGNPPLSEALRSRFVFVELDHSQRTEEAAQALRDLLDMHNSGGIDLYSTVKAAGDRLEGLLQHTTAYFVQPHDNKRAAFNHAQLHALLGVLDDLFVLPTEAREDAHIEVAAMCLITD
ncbi:hypothetical protein DN826_21380 [Stutzerimonas nosocomialis]|uniref:hypothetical protein n=1 Tax=Stutzerimonas nosocomialis TaxID=1056496 RepID=UPI001107BC07|nr:hypothetical protein [Stutzerimonas nosocomialis]TLX52873.1 hypothetical protein DN826_21380 [Stutzerimonas nosocomialis]